MIINKVIILEAKKKSCTTSALAPQMTHTLTMAEQLGGQSNNDASEQWGDCG